MIFHPYGGLLSLARQIAATAHTYQNFAHRVLRLLINPWAFTKIHIIVSGLISAPARCRRCCCLHDCRSHSGLKTTPQHFLPIAHSRPYRAERENVVLLLRDSVKPLTAIARRQFSPQTIALLHTNSPQTGDTTTRYCRKAVLC